MSLQCCRSPVDLDGPILLESGIEWFPPFPPSDDDEQAGPLVLWRGIVESRSLFTGQAPILERAWEAGGGLNPEIRGFNAADLPFARIRGEIPWPNNNASITGVRRSMYLRRIHDQQT